MKEDALIAKIFPKLTEDAYPSPLPVVSGGNSTQHSTLHKASEDEGITYSPFAKVSASIGKGPASQIG